MIDRTSVSDMVYESAIGAVIRCCRRAKRSRPGDLCVDVAVVKAVDPTEELVNIERLEEHIDVRAA